MATRDAYNNTEWDKFVAGEAGAAPVDLTCSTLNCTGDITDVYPGVIVNRGGAPETQVECDTCGFGSGPYIGWRIANHA